MRLLKGCLIALAVGIAGIIGLVVLVAVFGPRGTQQTVTAVGTPAPTAPAAPTAPTETKAPARIGDRVESGGIALTVNGTSRSNERGQLIKAKPGRVFAVADVTIETTGREKAPYNPLYFKVKDADGYEYTAGIVGPENALKSGELEQGGKVRGVVAFDVPAEAKALVLSYQPAVIFGGYQTIRIALE